MLCSVNVKGVDFYVEAGVESYIWINHIYIGNVEVTDILSSEVTEEIYDIVKAEYGER